jgi:hypothetical protein
VVAYVLLGLAQVTGLLMIPFGAPGVWVQLAALLGFAWWTDFAVIGVIPILILTIVALAAELAALALSGSKAFETKIRRRVGFAGLAGGGAGAAVGVPLPVLGSVFGALLGAFVGSPVGTFGTRVQRSSYAAMGGLLIATALKTAAGLAVAIFVSLVLLR